MRIGGVGIESGNLAEVSDGLVVPIQAHQYHGLRGECGSAVRTDLYRLAQSLLCFRETRFACQNQTQIYKSYCVLRIVLRRLAEQLLCLRGLAKASIQHTQIVLSFEILGIKRDCSLELAFCFSSFTCLQI